MGDLETETPNILGLLKKYDPPTWAADLSNIPKYTVQLGHLNTPIHRWNLPDIPEKYQISIKRDDLTGCSLSGNKVRKLEFIFAEAVAEGCKHVITTGGVQSNHCRDTAIVAAQLGIESHLVLKSNEKDISSLSLKGNAFLYRLVGAHIYLVPEKTTAEEINEKMEEISDTYLRDFKQKSRTIPRGGSDGIGVFGHIECFREMEKQGLLDNFDDIVVPCGSGTTLEGIALANYLTGSRLRVHGFVVNNNRPYFYEHVSEIMESVGIKGVDPDTLFDVTDKYTEGYAKTTPAIHDYIVKVARTTGIILDPVYTGKSVRGFVQEIIHNSARFKGNRILYMHTGGIFGLFDGKMDSTLLTYSKSDRRQYTK